jgi:hypothetical protein
MDDGADRYILRLTPEASIGGPDALGRIECCVSTSIERQ